MTDQGLPARTLAMGWDNGKRRSTGMKVTGHDDPAGSNRSWITLDWPDGQFTFEVDDHDGCGIAARIVDDLQAGAEALEGRRFECAVRKMGRSDPPQDCDWPSCGCDPVAVSVLEALEESGYAPVAPLVEALQSARAELTYYDRSDDGFPRASVLNVIDEIDAALRKYERQSGSDAGDTTNPGPLPSGPTKS